MSDLELARPLISVVIPTLNRYNYLEDILSDLEKQTYRNFEVIVCDQSDEFNESIYENRQLEIRVIRQSEKALWLARNQCIKAAKGEYVAFSEDDVRVEPDWLVQHLRCIHGFGVDISAGVFYPEGSRIPYDRSFYHWADQFATGNALIKKSVFNKTGLFDRQFERMRSGDGEFGARCFLNGFRSVSNPFACCVDVKAPTGGLRQMGSWDSFRPTRFFAPRPVPSVLYYVRKYFGASSAFFYC
jgi:Predicted glycosyltransferases